MVRHEMTGKSMQAYKVASKIAEHNIAKVSKQISKNINDINALLTFKNLANEKELFDARLKALKENIYATFAFNEDEANITLFKNSYQIHKLNWSTVKLDHKVLEKEKIRKAISLNRHATAIYDINLEESKLNSKLAKEELEAKIKYQILFDEKAGIFLKDNLPYKKESYGSFYQNVKDEYDKLKDNTIKEIDEIYPLIEKCVKESYAKCYGVENRKSILDLTYNINSLYDQILAFKKENILISVDLEVLKEQEKEKFDIATEREEYQKKISENEAKIDVLYQAIDSLKKQLDEAYLKRISIKQEDFVNEIKGNDDEVNSLLDEISKAFHLPSNEAFNKVYRLVKYYILAKVPYFEIYLLNKEKEYQKENESFRKENVDKLNDSLKKAYLKSEDKYYQALNNKEASDFKDENIKESIKKALNVFKKETKANSLARKARIKEYKEQKKNASIVIKQADAAKASELKEVVKLYKKEINTGEFARFNKALFGIFKNFIKFRKENKNLIIANTYPAPLVVKNDYLNEYKSFKQEKAYQQKVSKRALDKDFSSSKYRPNFTTATRENALGYLFLGIWAIGFVVFTLLPMIYTVAMLFSNISYSTTGYSKLIDFSLTDGITFPSFVGFDNFDTLFLSNVDFTYTYLPRFFRSLLFYVPIVVFIGFVLAMLLNSKIKGRTLFRIIYFLPVVIVSGPVLNMLNESNSSGSSSIRLSLDGSAVAKILQSISPKALSLANEIFNNFVIILWMTGVPIVLFISALQKINKSLYEAAEIDGANKWQTLWAVTFPLIKSIMLIVCLFTIMQVTTIEVSFVNPINSWMSSLLSTSGTNLSLVALGAWCQTIVVLLFVLVAFLLFREKEFVSKDKNFEEIEEMKRKKALRKAKLDEFFHISDIKNFFLKLNAPLIKLIERIKENKKEKEERRG